MRCAHCGTPCGEHEVFCAHCGAALLVEGGRVAEKLSTPTAPAVEKPAGGPTAVPAIPRRRMSRRGRLLFGGVCAALAAALAVLAGLARPSEGFQARPAALLHGPAGRSQDSECFYYDGQPVVGAEEGLIGLSLFLDGESCLAIDTDGYLTAVVTADGAAELDLPEGTLSAYAAAADGSALYCALEDGSLWRCPLPGGEPERLVEGCAVDRMQVSPSGDAAAYFDRNTGSWYRVGSRAAPEALPLPEDAAVFCISDGGRYVYYTLVNADNTNGDTSITSPDRFLYCWDGAASHLAGHVESFSVLTNRTGDQLLLMGSAGTYLVDGIENHFWPGALFPLWLLQKSGGSGTYSANGITVADCADLSRGYFVSSEYQGLYRMEGDSFTPALEETEIFYLGADASGSVLWYVREGDLWQFRDGRSTLQWEDIGGEASLRGVSPDGDTVLVYQSGNGLCRLTAGGTLELLEGGLYPYPTWSGFYYDDGESFWYVPWEGAPEEVEELRGVRGLSYTTSSPLWVELRDGSTWHVIDGMDPIQVTGARSDGA